METISPTKPTLRQTVPATPSKSTRVLFTPHKKQYHTWQQDQPSPTPMSTTMPTQPLFSRGSDEESSTGLSPQVETLSLGSSESQASSKGQKEQSKKKRKGKGGGGDVREFFEMGKGKGKGKGNKGKGDVDVNVCKFCM